MNENIQQQNNKLVNSLKNTLKNTHTIKPLAAGRPDMQTKLQQSAPTIQETPKANVGERIGATVGEITLAPLTMVGKFGEGILDAGASVVGTIGGWFNKGFQDNVDNWVKKDLVGNSGIGKAYSNLQQQSYLNDGYVGQTIRGAWEGVWQSLPSLALSFLPGGQVVSLTALGISAAGNGIEEALQSGATHDQAMLYGVLSGATEVATEKMFGGTNITSRAYGSGYLDKFIKSGKGRLLKGMLEEGVEEGVSTLVNPLLQRITFNKNAEFLTLGHIKQIGQDALVGGLSAGITQGAVNTTRYGRVSNNLQILQQTNAAKQKLFENNNLNNQSINKISADELKAKTNISKELMAMTEERRNKYLNKNGLGKFFNADGSIKALNNNKYNKNTYSPMLEGKENELVFKPLEKGVELTDDQRYAKDVFNKLNRNQNVSIVFTNDLTADKKGAYHNGVLYINSNANALQQVAIHELTHSIEGSKQYNNFRNYVIKEIEGNENLRKEYGSYFEKYNKVASQYGSNIDTAKSNFIDQLIENDSETIAKYVSENLFTNEESINRLAKADGNLFKKIYNWIKLKIENYQKRKSLSKEQREVFDFLRNAEKLYKKALDAQGEQSIDKTIQKQYSLNEKENYSGKTNQFKWFSTTDSIDRDRRNSSVSAIQGLSKIHEQKIIDNAENVKQYKNLILQAGQYDNVSFIDQVDNQKVECNIKIVNKNAINNELQSLITENKGFGIETLFYIDDSKSMSGTWGYLSEDGRIFIEINELHPDIANTNRHEKVHYFKQTNVELYNILANELNKIITQQERVRLYNKYRNTYQSVYGSEQQAAFSDSIFEEIYAQIYATNETLANQQGVFDAIDKFESALKKQYHYNGEIKFSIADDNGSKISTIWGDGFSLKESDYKDYNLIAFKNDVGLNAFNALMSEVEQVIKNNSENKNVELNLRLNLFNNLQQQKDRVYSKLIEINKALAKTKKSFYNNKTINIKKTFIKNLGYNGLYVDPKTKTSYKSVVYDVKHKKENLLDYSIERAKERLDKTIQLFGETKNPKKAGWLLSDGRFVDYNRDSANILNEGDYELDYQDHYQIEKVYSSRRGTDAIDAFMAEGNIRLMPEGGGIEIRNKPTSKQITKLEQYINAIIDEKGITLDLRKPNSTENILPNYVYYDNSKNARTIISDINSYYNNGTMPRTINGLRWSLADDVDTFGKVNYNVKNINELWQQLTKVEQAQFYNAIDAIYHQNNYEYQLNNGNYVIDVGNKIIISDGDFNKPSIEAMVELASNDAKNISKARDLFYEKCNRGAIWESIRYCNSVCQEQVATLYGNENSQYYWELQEQRRNYSQNRKNYRDEGRDKSYTRAGSNREDIKYSLDNKVYNEHQYQKFGWVRANNVLDSKQWKDFNQKFIAARNGTKVNRAASGALIIPVNGLTAERFGINNVLVYAKGTIVNPQIEKIIKINLYDETSLDLVRRDIYEAERHSNNRKGKIALSYYGEEFVRELSGENCRSYQEYKRDTRAYQSRTDSKTNLPNNRQIEERNRNIGSNREDIKYSLDNKVYNEHQYQKFGWVRANNILNSLEWKDFNSKYIKARNGTKVNKSSSGALIIPVNGLTAEKFGINNVLVYAKGTVVNPQIEKIIKINLNDETSLDLVRREIYELEKYFNYQASTYVESLFGQELVWEFSQRDVPTYREYKRKIRSRESGRGSGKSNKNYREQ